MIFLAADYLGIDIGIWMMIISGLWAIIGFAIFWTYKKFLEPRFWPNTVIIFQDRSNAIFPLVDIAKIIKTTSEGIYLKLKHHKNLLPPLKLKQTMVMRGGRDLIMLFSPAYGEYYPVELNKVNKLIEIIPEDMKHMLTLQMREIDLRYPQKKSWVEAWLPIIASIVTILVMLGFVYVAGNEMISLIAQGQAAVSASAANKLDPVIQNLNAITGQITGALGPAVAGINPPGGS